MELEDVKRKIKNWISQFENKELEECYELVINDINTLQEDEKPGDIDAVLEKVRNEIRDISQKLLYEGIEKEFTIFSKAFVYLVYNWNDNTIKDVDIDIMCSFIIHIINSNNMMVDVRKIMQDTREHLITIKSWRPPAIDMSKEYLRSLLK